MLKKRIKSLQNQLWTHAWHKPIIPVIDELEITATNKSGEDLNEPRLYRKIKKTSRKRDWRTRKDPFEHVKEFIELEVELNPRVNPKDILEKLINNYPGEFCKGHLRTLQRRVSELRDRHNNREQKYQELMVNKKSMTTDLLNDTMSI